MQNHLRIIQLSCLARVRAAGWAPWLLLGAWLLAALLQEPRMLRRFGIQLVDDAAWSGFLLLLLILLTATRRLPARGAIIANLVLLAAVACLEAAACAVLDRGPWSDGLLRRLEGGGAFFLAFAPLVVCLAVGHGPTRSQQLTRWLVVLVAALTGSILAAAMRPGLTVMGGVAALAALSGALAWSLQPHGRHKYL